MPSATSLSRFHVYTLRSPLIPGSSIQFVLVVTNNEYVNRREHKVVSVLPLRNRVRDVESPISVKIQSIGNGGTARLPGDHFIAIDSLLPLPATRLMETSGTPISPLERQEVTRKLRDWLDL